MAFELENCCNASTQTGPTGPTGPQGPTGPSGPSNAVFCFGSGLQEILVGEQIAFPIPSALAGYIMGSWRLRLITEGGGDEGNIELELYAADSITDAEVLMAESGGPFVMAVVDARGADGTVTVENTALVAGGVLIAKIATIGAGDAIFGATLVIELGAP